MFALDSNLCKCFLMSRLKILVPYARNGLLFWAEKGGKTMYIL
jgi:hypothetical protein